MDWGAGKKISKHRNAVDFHYLSCTLCNLCCKMHSKFQTTYLSFLARVSQKMKIFLCFFYSRILICFSMATYLSFLARVSEKAKIFLCLFYGRILICFSMARYCFASFIVYDKASCHMDILQPYWMFIRIRIYNIQYKKDSWMHSYHHYTWLSLSFDRCSN